jgi:hypothetical protein
MSFYKNFQRKNIHTQANTTFKYLLLTSVKNYTNSLSSTSQNQNIFRSKYQYFSFQLKKLLTSKAKSTLLFKNFLQQPVNKTDSSNKIFIKSNNFINRNHQYETNNSKNVFTMFIATFTNISLLYNSFFNINKSILNKNFILKMNKKFQVKKTNFNNNYSSLKKWFVQKSANVSKKFNLKVNLMYNNNSKKKSSFYFASFSSLSMFSWNDYKINDQEVKNEVNDILSFFKENSNSNEEKNQDSDDNNDQNKNNNINSIGTSNYKLISLEEMRNKEDDEWKIIYDQPNIIIWRRNINLAEVDSNESNVKVDYDLYEYKVLGKIDDINAIEFFQTQIDLKYRQEWFVTFFV